MYPRNAASPPRIAVGAIYLIADGSKVVADASVVVCPEGGAESAGLGTLVVGATSGAWYYTPTQSETNYTAFAVIVYKSACTVANITVVTTAENTAGKVSLGAAQTTNITGTVSGNEVAGAAAAALAAVNLDHLVGTATDIPAVPAGTYVDQMMDDGTAAYDRTTDSLQAQKDAALTAAGAFAAVLTTQMTEAYAVDGVAPTLAQAIFLIQQSLHEFAISGTTRTVKKLDGSTTAAVFTLDSATAPTSTTRAS